MVDVKPSARVIAMEAFDTMMALMKERYPELNYKITASICVAPADLPEFIQEMQFSGDL